jgi:hypothetical protein
MAESDNGKPVEVRFECPHCLTEIDDVEEHDTDWISCRHCGKKLNLASQLALERADHNYILAQELATPELTDRKRRQAEFSPEARDALFAYQRAYSGVQVALRADLPAAQQTWALEIMAGVASILQLHQMISGLEARYWIQRLVCQTIRQEYETLDARLSEPHPSLLTRILRHPFWYLRRRQLRRALIQREKSLEMLERELAFIDVPHL